MRKFFTLRKSYCDKCKQDILHEIGYDTELKLYIKVCIKCDRDTEIPNPMEKTK